MSRPRKRSATFARRALLVRARGIRRLEHPLPFDEESRQVFAERIALGLVELAAAAPVEKGPVGGPVAARDGDHVQFAAVGTVFALARVKGVANAPQVEPLEGGLSPL